jgi:hypothetical protein
MRAVGLCKSRTDAQCCELYEGMHAFNYTPCLPKMHLGILHMHAIELRCIVTPRFSYI